MSFIAIYYLVYKKSKNKKNKNILVHEKAAGEIYCLIACY